MPKAKEFQQWVVHDVLGSIAKYNKYIPPQQIDNTNEASSSQITQYKASLIIPNKITAPLSVSTVKILDEFNIPQFTGNVIDYENANILYIGLIGIIDKELIFKFGISHDAYTRIIDDHRKMFGMFEIVEIIECDLNRIVETKFKKHLIEKNLLRTYTVNDKNNTEVFIINEEHTIQVLIDKLKDLVNCNKTNSLKIAEQQIEKYEDHIEKEALKNHITKLETRMESSEHIFDLKSRLEIEKIKSEYANLLIEQKNTYEHKIKTLEIENLELKSQIVNDKLKYELVLMKAENEQLKNTKKK